MKQRIDGIDGDAITNALRAFNRWRDEFLIELSTLLLLVGFVMGTIDILARKGIAVQGWFTVTWAIVQAIAIDGLFFAVWSRVARAEWTWRTAPKNMSMIVVGLILALVAMVVNGILGYQQVAGIADSFTAMTALHISASAFALTRAILVVSESTKKNGCTNA